MKTKTIALLLAVALVFGGVVGGTVAWLTDKTDEVVNTFTTSDINITLDESDNLDLKMVPGKTITKDPVVTVKADSEACWLFVKVDEQNWPTCKEADDETLKVNYAIAEGWIKLEGVDGVDDVYYREVAASNADQPFPVLAGNQVTVSDTMTKAEMEAITTDPTLTFTAYAIQKDSFATAAAAWTEVSKTS